MNKLTIELEHCYGIKRLKAVFDFKEHGNVVAVYAPNGVMKTSFANTFRDLSKGSETTDRVWPQKRTKRVVLDEHGNDLTRESIFVIEPYNQEFRSEKISTLLVNDGLRERYDAIHNSIDEKAESLIADLKLRTGLKEGIREELAYAITQDRKEFYGALRKIEQEVEDTEDSAFGNVVYIEIFNAKVADLLADSSFRGKVREYIEKYDELLSKSTFFKKGVFTHNNAIDIAKSLHSNGFFNASHSVFLWIAGEKKEIGSLKELEGAIQAEKDGILKDKTLKSLFEEIDKKLTRNKELRTLRQCLAQSQFILPELASPEQLKRKLWIAYLVRSKDKFNELRKTLETGQVEISKIVDEAKEQQTRWDDVIRIFNDRFSLPFVVRMQNQEDVILKRDAPTISFDFLENPNDLTSSAVPVAEGSLMQVLSNGEKRALYILNIIFEIEARKASNQETLFVIDDIADSFDYKNKYAIIEYLKEVGEETGFRQVILSHNFDFYRTVAGRLNVSREHRMFACKTNDEVSLTEEFYQKSPFYHWRKGLDNETMLIASIPFLRNLAEFSGDNVSFERLTSLLHVKSDTGTITVGYLESLIKGILKDKATLSLNNQSGKVKDLIYRVASEIAANPAENQALENKVVLSIAIRLRAEDLMITKISDTAFVAGITSNQTIKLIKRFKADFPDEKEAIRIYEQVNLMTPENIHLNSFMYEPILDMAADHLKKLYQRLFAMK